MTKKEIAAHVALRTGVTHKRAVAIIDQMLAEIKSSLARGDKVEIRGFGVFKVRYTKEKVARDLSTNTQIVIGPTRRVKFIPGKDMKTKLNRAPRLPAA
jgi:nucleoid DNA-binding protein